MKKLFFGILDPTLTHILAIKDPKKNFIHRILVKKDKNYIIINSVTLQLTKVKLLNIINFFAIFDPNQAEIWP